MGGKAAPKRETNAERNARMLAAKKSSGDTLALRDAAERARRARRRSDVFGGPETGMTTLGGGASALGVM